MRLTVKEVVKIKYNDDKGHDFEEEKKKKKEQG